MRPADREMLEEVLVAVEDHVIEIIRAAQPVAVGVGSTVASRQRTRDRLVDAVEELISHSELSK